MSNKQPSLLGDYVVSLYQNNSLHHQDDTLTFTLLPGLISVSQSSCSYYGCLHQEEECSVFCTIRDEGGSLITGVEETLILHIHTTGLTRQRRDYEERIVMTNLGNGTYMVSPSIVYAGNMVMIVKEQRNGQIFKQQFTTVIPVLSVSKSHSFLLSDIPVMHPIENPLHLELLVADKNDNRICYYEDSNSEFSMKLEIQSFYNHIRYEEYDIPFTTKGSCSDSQGRYSLSLDYFFMHQGTAMVQIVYHDPITGDEIAIDNGIIELDAPGCSQEETKTFQCFSNPTEEEMRQRSFKSVCVDSSKDCAIGVQGSECNSTSSYCWGFREFLPRCTNALSSTLECYCISNKCSTGQCYKNSTFCPQEIVCPKGYVVCPDYHCAKDIRYCSSMIACPPSTVLCGDLKRCGLSREECNFNEVPTCPRHSPLLCWDGVTCVYDYHNCPTMSQCPPNQVRCESGICRNSVEECAIGQPCPLDKPLRCSDGTCSSLTQVTCSSIMTCPPDHFLSTDGRCLSHHGHGHKALSSSGVCPPHMVTCADHTCASTRELCPSSVRCPYGMVMCSDRSCRPSVYDCPTDKEECPPPLILCPNKECVGDPEECYQGITCPHDKPVLCARGACVADVVDCTLQNSELFFYTDTSSSFYLSSLEEVRTLKDIQVIVPSLLLNLPVCPNAFSYYCSSVGKCVTKPSDCPVLPSCPTSKPFRCFDGRCAADSNSCPEAGEVACPMNTVYCAYTNMCVKSFSLCPSVRVCHTDETLCMDNSCSSLLTGYATKPSYLTDSSVVDNLWYTYLIGSDLHTLKKYSINLQITSCISDTLNHRDFYLRCCDQIECSGKDYEDCINRQLVLIEEECELKYRHYPCTEECEKDALSMVCPSDKIRCFDGRCVDSIDDCSDITICPRDRPIRCMNNQCVVSKQMCEEETRCIDGYVLCEDGSCASSIDKCSVIQCPSESPFLCWDQSCRRSPDDCPDFTICSEGTYFCSISGRCVYDRSTCVSNSLVVKRDVFASFPFCYNKVLCPDGSCRASQFDCPSVGCSFPSSYQCPSGLCVGSPSECESFVPQKRSSFCSAEQPFLCSDGSCVGNSSECALSSFCPAPFKRCSNGLCVLSLTLCPVVFPTLSLPQSLNSNEPHLRFIRFDDISFFVRTQYNSGFDDVHEMRVTNSTVLCPSSRPFLCATGDCVVSSDYCPVITPCSTKFFNNGDVRCLDRSCTYDQRTCTNVTVCPDYLPYMCRSGSYSGMCVLREDLCLNEDGCPYERPYKCMNGDCVKNKNACYTHSIGNGCPPATPYKCVTKECVANREECSLVNGCSPLTPFKSRSGLCYRSPQDDVLYEENKGNTTCPSTKPFQCWDNTCVTSRMECPLRNGCSIDKPNRCASGECAGFLNQYPYKYFVPALEVIDPVITESINSQKISSVCSATPVCPPDQPYLCANMDCVGDSSLCQPCTECYSSSRNLPYCPPTRPIYCPDGSCVKNQGDCAPSQQCPPNQPYSCFNGDCASKPSDCVYDVTTDLERVYIDITKAPISSAVKPIHFSKWWWWEEEEITETELPYSFTLCPNGVFADIANCPPIPACSPRKPKRCVSGACVGLDEPCEPVFDLASNAYDSIVPLSHFFYPIKHGNGDQEHFECITGVLCSDGICRPYCPLSPGCGVGMIQCPDGTCVNPIPGLSDKEVCKGLGNCQPNEYRCFYGYCSQSIEDCYQYSYYNHIAEDTMITLSPTGISTVTLHTTQHEVYGLLDSSPAVVSPAQPFFIRVSPVSSHHLHESSIVVKNSNRGFELNLNQEFSAITLQASVAVALSFISIQNDTVIDHLDHPLILSLILQRKATFLPLTVYDSTVYRESTDIRDDEYCPAQFKFFRWECLEESEYVVEKSVYRIKVDKPMELMLMVNPKNATNVYTEEEDTTTSLIINYLESSLWIVILVVIVFIVWITFLLRYRLQWEESKDSFSVMRIRTDVGGIMMREINHTTEWKQIDITSGAAKRDNMKQNPLAVKRAKEIMFDNQMNRLQETSKKNEEIIRQRTTEKEELMVYLVLFHYS